MDQIAIQVYNAELIQKERDELIELRSKWIEQRTHLINALKEAKVAWETARGRVHANFGHVPEAMRACDWIEFEMQKALATINKALEQSK